MSRLLLLALFSFIVPDAVRVLGKVHHTRRSVDEGTPILISLNDNPVPMETDDVSGGRGLGGDRSGRRFKRQADNEKLLVNTSILPDEGHNEAIVHWSGKQSLVRFLATINQSTIILAVDRRSCC